MITRLTSRVSALAATPWFFVINSVVCVAGLGFAVADQGRAILTSEFSATVSVAAWLLANLLLVSQRAGNAALHAKLDALIRVSEADDALIRAEERQEAEIEALRCDPLAEADEEAEAPRSAVARSAPPASGG